MNGYDWVSAPIIHLYIHICIHTYIYVLLLCIMQIIIYIRTNTEKMYNFVVVYISDFF